MRSFLIFLMVLVSGSAYSQSEVYEKTVALSGKRVIIDAELVDQIKVSNWDQNEVGIKITYAVNDGELNDAVEISLDESSGRIRLEVELDERKIESSEYEGCDDKHSMNWGKNGRRNSVCLDILVEVQLPKSADLDIESVIGDLLIDGSFKELHAKTVTGDIDLIWPESEGADVEIKTVTGAIYTNHDLESKNSNKGLPLISAHEVQASLGKGGKYIALETVTSDIYFKKGR